jgi:hypothetical protein
MSQPLREHDPVLAAAESAPLVPLSAEEEELLAKARAVAGDWVEHDVFAQRIASRADDSSE